MSLSCGTPETLPTSLRLRFWGPFGLFQTISSGAQRVPYLTSCHLLPTIRWVHPVTSRAARFRKVYAADFDAETDPQEDVGHCESWFACAQLIHGSLGTGGTKR